MTTDICTEDVIVQITSPEENNAASGTNRLNSNSTGSDLSRKLLLAAKNGDTDAVLSLLAAGAPFSTDWLGTSALHLAAGAGHTRTAAVLLRAGGVRDARTKVERTPLHMAAAEGHAGVVALLLQHGAAVDCRDMLRMTPLHWAARRGRAAAAAALLAAGADPALEDKFGHRAAGLAARAAHHALAETLLLAERKIPDKPPDPPVAPGIVTIPKVQEIPSAPEPKKVKPNPTFERITIKPDPDAAFTDNEQSALGLLARHGITLQPRDTDTTVTSALRHGRTIVLSDAGKLMLKESAASLAEPPPAPAPAPAAPRAPAPAPAHKIVIANNNVNVGDLQVKYVLPRDVRVVSGARGAAVGAGAAAGAARGAGARGQPLKIIVNKASFSRLLANKHAALQLPDRAQCGAVPSVAAGSVATGAATTGAGSVAATTGGVSAGGTVAAGGADEAALLRAELAAARCTVARLTGQLHEARRLLAGRGRDQT